MTLCDIMKAIKLSGGHPMAKYRAKMQHNRSTIHKLIQTQYDTFQFQKKLVHIVKKL